MTEHMTAEQVRAIADRVAGLRVDLYIAAQRDIIVDDLREIADRLSGMAAVQWTHVDDAEPAHDTRNHSLGKEYLVHPSTPGERTAFYGRRLGGKAQWYLHGAPVTGITHYAPLPEPPHV